MDENVTLLIGFISFFTFIGCVIYLEAISYQKNLASYLELLKIFRQKS